MGFENWKEKLELATDHLDNCKYCVFFFSYVCMNGNSFSISYVCEIFVESLVLCSHSNIFFNLYNF